MTSYTDGALWSSTLPSWQRDYYSMLLLETLRTKSIMVPFTHQVTDYEAAKSGVIVHTEVYDTEPNINPLAETDIWLRGAYMDSRTVRVELGIHGDVLKFSDYSSVVQFVNRGDMRGLVREKIGQNQVDYLDILARNAFLSSPYKTFAGGAANRAALAQADVFHPDMGEIIRTHLEEREVPGVQAVSDADVQTIVCVTTPRVVHDIRVAAGSNWIDVQNYHNTGRKFTREAGQWGGVRFVRTNRMMLRNHGAVVAQTTLNGATVPGQGAAATVDSVYTPGQSGSTRFITVTNGAAFSVGQYITIHSVALNGGAGFAPLETDGTSETRLIVGKNVHQLALDKPLLKPHPDLDLVTTGVHIHASAFMGGPAVVYGVGEAPNVIIPPKNDDLLMINRYGWRGFLKFQMFRPEFVEVIESGGSTN